MRTRAAPRWIAAGLAVLMSLAANPALAQARIALVYPEVPHPYRLVFEGIRRGVEARVEADSLSTFYLEASPSANDALDAWLEREDPAVVITLGQRATIAYARNPRPAVHVVGALDTSPQARPTATGISISPAPARLFDTLTELQPQVQRVWVVADPVRDAWQVELARSEARARGLEIEVRPATNLKSAAKQCVDILRKARPRTDALWVLDNTQLINNKATMPYVVERAWARDLPVFSSTLQHARLGALFAVYPDPEPLGRELGDIALAAARGAPPPPIRPLTKLRRAINRRTARHLDAPVDLERFDLVFPRY